jgi:hypothetical protein
MFDRGSENYRSDLKLGEKYRDRTTDLVGTLVAIHFYEHACERGTLRYVNGQQDVAEASFDAPELVHIDTDAPARAAKPGGPARADGRRTQP